MKTYVIALLALILGSASHNFAKEEGFAKEESSGKKETFVKSQDFFPATVTIYKSNGVSYKITKNESEITLDLDKIHGEYIDHIKAEFVDKLGNVVSRYTSTPQSEKDLNKMIERGVTKIVMQRIDDDPYYPGTKTIHFTHF